MTRTTGATADTEALLRTQSGVLERIAGGAPLTEVLTEVAITLERLMPGCHCSILLLDLESATLRHGAAPSLPAAYSSGIDGLPIGRDAGSCGTAAFLGIPIVAEDVTTDPRWVGYRELAGAHGLRACWSTPIRGRDNVVGTFAVYHERPHQPTPREQDLVDRLTHLASVAIDHDILFGALADSEERFRRAFDDNAIGMAITDPGGAVTRTNQALRRLLGRSEHELTGVRLAELFSPAGTPPAPYEATLRHPDGRTLDVVVSVSPVAGPDGMPVRLIANVLDVTQRRAAERERRGRHEADVARQAAERASRAKTDFVAALGHELRTPLQAVTGFTELLGSLDLPPERRRAALEHINGAAGHILAMVDDVLDIARIEARALPLHPADIDVPTVVAEVLSLLEPLADAEGVRFRDESGASTAHCDERRLKQILLNLAGNAVRYNRAGGTVAITTRAEADAVVITVADSGCGIAPEHLDRLFTPFDRLGADSGQGVGLGLPLAKGLTEAMGGRLAFTSVLDEGTTVEVTLPRRGR
ncbi:ATP-binding protein [Amycolatopsis oliviviridis]|uniref:histidine kinase n=1 Tax=Amycolatopsis oliviviridis TaxID=1471590 RepID=A0ABQ3MC73_9PSEU|nr:ATP-binding protein [Amycolatopsis oliviviridis]GHH37682.1 hybrid sensor histidine kinase/response regulator [Amycolatopsis oliviviridis]